MLETNHIPKCRSCERSCPSIEELLSKRTKNSSSLDLPSDESIGQINLSWPKSVRYVRRQRSRLHSRNPSSTTQPHPTITSSPIYGKLLKNDEFRLACLVAVADEKAPVHLTFEVFADADHPEYECTSYTWAGENNDSTLRKEVYIGPYWDVLLQTKNCWSMLRHLRPWKGIRMVWVDAIRIDQGNLQERAAQVAKMRQIYEHCSRVVVYLGEDLVTATTRFPSSRTLDSFNQETPKFQVFPPGHRLHRTQYGLKGLLSRRYFSRIWVIQELVVSERAIIRVGDVNFRADANIIRKVPRTVQSDESNPVWDLTAAPWVQHCGQGAFSSSRVRDVLSLLQLTARSRASDPRDRLFGVISLLQNPRQQENFEVDYSLSFRHFSVGFFAHLILVELRCWFLYRAGTMARSGTVSTFPSWVPDCRSDTSWQELILAAPTTKDQLERHGYKVSKSPPFCLYHHPSSTSPSHRVFPSINNNRRLIENMRVTSDGELRLNIIHLFSLQDGLYLENVDDSLKIFSVPRKTTNGRTQRSDLMIVCLENLVFNPTSDHLVILATKSHLGQPIENSDYDGCRYIAMILRERSKSSSLQTFELVTTSVRLFERNRLNLKDLGNLQRKANHNLENWSMIGDIATAEMEGISLKVATAIRTIQTESLEFFSSELGNFKDALPTLPNAVGSKKIYDKLTELHGDYFPHFCLVPFWQTCFPGVRTYDDMLCLILEMCCKWNKSIVWSYGSIDGGSLQNAYLDSIGRKFKPEIEQLSEDQHDPCIKFTFERAEWFERFQYYYLLHDHEAEDDQGAKPVRPSWRWKFESEKGWHRTYDRVSSPLPSPKRLLERVFVRGSADNINVRGRLMPILHAIDTTLELTPRALSSLLETFDPKPDTETLIQMIKNGPTEEQERMGVTKYIGGAKIDGSLWRIGIV